ncbi:MAG: hypothetical protein QXU65_05880, partial [Sulfolobales archaeon]
YLTGTELTESCRWDEVLAEVRKLFSVKVADDVLIPSIRDMKVSELISKFRECFIIDVLGQELAEAVKWLEHVNAELNILSTRYRLSGYSLPREFKSFKENPLAHLKKKIFIYVYDYARGKIGLKELVKKASSAAYTSLRTNMRSAYQVWGFSAILNYLFEEGYSMHFPEHRYLTIDRAGKQKQGKIPPNTVLFNPKRGFISFFYEAPRPLSWEDSEDLQAVWSLYTTLRPDMMVYSGKVMDIVELGSNPPVKRPNMLVEFKELADWYERSRDLKSYFKKSPLTAEEWRSKWLSGLYTGLADALGVKKSEIRKSVEEGKPLRIKEYKLIQVYTSLYKPERTFLVSRSEVPQAIKSELEDNGIEVVDGVGFDRRKLKPVAETVESYSSFLGADYVSIDIPVSTVIKLAEYAERVGLKDLANAIEELLKKV